MYSISELRINEADEDSSLPSRKKKTISVTVECSGYEKHKLARSYEVDYALAGSGRGEVGPQHIYLTLPYTEDPRKLAASIKEEIVKMKRDDSAEKLLLGKLRQLGPAALNP